MAKLAVLSAENGVFIFVLIFLLTKVYGLKIFDWCRAVCASLYVCGGA